jgi:hypothetical protein
MLISEMILVLCNKTVIPMPILNLYLHVQIGSGILRKASLLGLSVFAGMAIKSRTLVGFIVGAIGILCILIEQGLTWRTLFHEYKIDQDAVFPNIERT